MRFVIDFNTNKKIKIKTLYKTDTYIRVNVLFNNKVCINLKTENLDAYY